jgi:hypothetical protein
MMATYGLPYSGSNISAAGSGGGGISLVPNPYNDQANLEMQLAAAGGIYTPANAMMQTTMLGGNNAPGLDANITAQTVGQPGALAGGAGNGVGAAGLQGLALAQAQKAANSPSAAAAQMKAAEQGIEQQQAGIASQARGSERAGAKRALMLGIGTQEQGAALTSAQLAAQEEETKQAAYTNALLGEQGANTAVAGLQNQAALANQQANLAAQTGTIQARQGAYNATNNAALGYGGLATGAVNAGTAAQGVAANYASNQASNSTQMNKALLGGLSGGTGAVLGGLAGLSDEATKTDIDDIEGSLATPSGTGLETPSSTHSDASASDAYEEKPKNPYLDTMAKVADKFSKELEGAYGTSSPSLYIPSFDRPAPVTVNSQAISDARAKEAVKGMSDEDLIDWAHKPKPVTFYYKDGFADGGKDAQLGVVAQQLEKTGPMGKMMVHKDENGLRHVDYGQLAFMTARAALKQAEKKSGGPVYSDSNRSKSAARGVYSNG